MKWTSKAVNGLLGQFDLRLTRASSFNKLLSEFGRQHEQLKEWMEERDYKRLEEREHKRLLNLSQVRWRGDEPDNGLTWGVLMSGAEFVRVLGEHFTFENSSIVEIGPGYGRILDGLLKCSAPFRHYIGLEISAARVARLRDQFRDSRIEFRQADVLDTVDLNAVADLTFSSAVFEHLYPDFSRALQTVSRITRPGGVAVIDFIRDDDDIEKSAAWFDNETYMRTYSTDELKTLFANSGFTIRHSEKISFGADILNREITRTIVVAAKASLGTSIEVPETSTQFNVEPFDALVDRALPACDPHTVKPPFVPEFRSKFGGFWTDLNNADAILAGKLAAGELSPSEANLLETWRRDGFVILRGAVDEVAIDRAVKDFELAYDGSLKCKMSYWDDEGHLHYGPASRDLVLKKDAKLLDLYDVSEATQAIQFAGPISRFFQILFERPALAFQSLGFYFGSQQQLHRDSAFVRVNSPMEFVASWIALEDIQPGSGELEYYVGSHTLPEYLFGGEHLWVQPGDPEVQLFAERLHARAREAGLHMQRFLPKKGDVLIWSAELLHSGSAIQPPVRTRKSLVTHYCPADLQPMYAYKGGRPKRKSVAGHYVIAERYE